MAWYRAGSIAIANGSKNLTGTGTAWVNNAQPGDAVILPDGAYYEVDLVGGNGAITLVESYVGTTVPSGGAYKIIPTQGRVRDLAASVLQLIADYGSVEAALTVLAGNVGLGKSPNASARLDVSGQVWIDAPSGDATLRMLASGTEKAKMAVTSAGRGYLESNGTESLTWLNGGIGIGTATPSSFSAKLAVVGAGDTRISVIDDATNSRGGYLRSSGAEVILGTTSGVRDLVLSPDNNEAMRLDTAGNTRLRLQTSAPTLAATGEFNITRVSNTVIRLRMRGSDGVVRYQDLTLAP